MSVEETTRRRWAAFEPIRIRIMQEAYDCADRNEAEAYNSIKVMCGEVLKLAEEMVSTEREACAKVCDDWPNGRDDVYSIGAAIRARGNT
jgi:hypothetical protein